MRSHVPFTAAALWLVPLLGWLGGAGQATESAKPQAAPSCSGDYGTSIEFDDTPQEAAKRALKEEKLVFVLHVSGHFEDPKLT
jgi:hypothetical protein